MRCRAGDLLVNGDSPAPGAEIPGPPRGYGVTDVTRFGATDGQGAMPEGTPGNDRMDLS